MRQSIVYNTLAIRSEVKDLVRLEAAFTSGVSARNIDSLRLILETKVAGNSVFGSLKRTLWQGEVEITKNCEGGYEVIQIV